MSGTFSLEPSGPGRLRASGALDFDTAIGALALGRTLMRAGPHWQVDLSGVSSADSAGLAVLLEWLARARAAGQALEYVGLPAQLRAIARISDVEDLLIRSPAAQGSIGS